MHFPPHNFSIYIIGRFPVEYKGVCNKSIKKKAAPVRDLVIQAHQQIPTGFTAASKPPKELERRFCRGFLPQHAENQGILCNQSRHPMQPPSRPHGTPTGVRGESPLLRFPSAALRRFRRAKAASVLQYSVTNKKPHPFMGCGILPSIRKTLTWRCESHRNSS